MAGRDASTGRRTPARRPAASERPGPTWASSCVRIHSDSGCFAGQSHRHPLSCRARPGACKPPPVLCIGYGPNYPCLRNSSHAGRLPPEFGPGQRRNGAALHAVGESVGARAAAFVRRRGGSRGAGRGDHTVFAARSRAAAVPIFRRSLLPPVLRRNPSPERRHGGAAGARSA